MNRIETTIEERGEPQLVYLVREHGGAPIQLVIVEEGHTKKWIVSDDRMLRMVADGAGMLATRRKI